jgi:hypothetical protein
MPFRLDPINANGEIFEDNRIVITDIVSFGSEVGKDQSVVFIIENVKIHDYVGDAGVWSAVTYNRYQGEMYVTDKESMGFSFLSVAAPIRIEGDIIVEPPSNMDRFATYEFNFVLGTDLPPYGYLDI